MSDWIWERQAMVGSWSPCEWFGAERGSPFAENEVRLGCSCVQQVGLRRAEEPRALDEPGVAQQRPELVAVPRPGGRGSVVEGVGRCGTRRLELNETAAGRAQNTRELGDHPRHLIRCGVDDGVASDDGVKVLVGVWQRSQVADGESQTRVCGAG